MSVEVVYIDSSALAKWYIERARLGRVRDFIRGQQLAMISRLTVVEVRSLLARRRRAGEIIELSTTDGRRWHLRDRRAPGLP